MSQVPTASVRLAAVGLLLCSCTLFTAADVKRGDHHLAAGNWEEAALAYKQALKDDPFNEGLENKYAMARERAAAVRAERGRALLKDRQIEPAIEEFKRALALEPSNGEYQSGLSEAVRIKDARDQHREAERLAQLGRTDEAMEGFARAAELDPGFKAPLEGISKLTEEQQTLMRDDRRKQPVTLKFRSAGLKEVLEGIAKAGGLNLIFDKDVRNDPVTISVQETPFEDAFNLILNSNSLFARTVGPELMIISPNTKQKQEQYQDQMIRTFYLSNAKAKDMLVLLKSMLDSKRMHANEQLNAIVVRDQPEKLALAEKIILSNDRQEPEVLFDVEVLEVNRTKNQTYGLNYGKQAGVGLIPPGFTGTMTPDPQQFTYRQLTSLGPDSYLFRLPTTLLLDFFKQESDAKTLAAPKIRVVNNKKAEINIGDKQPILLSTTNVLPGQTTTGALPITSTVTSIEFRDTGVKLTVEPSIRLANELSLKMKIEVIRVGDQVTLQASPLIQQFKFGNRTAETMLNIKDGETIILGGLLQEEDRRTRTTIPWIGDIPVIGDLLSSFKTERVTTEVILTITPHIVQAMMPPSLSHQAFWSGTESTYATAPLFSGSSVKRVAASMPANGVSARPAPFEPARPAPFQSASPAVLAIRPDESAVSAGKDLTIEIVDERLRPHPDQLFTLEYDPQVLRFKTMTDADVMAGGGDESGDGTITFKIAENARRVASGGRAVFATFQAKAPGVSTVRVELVDQDGAVPALHASAGRGIVRVR